MESNQKDVEKRISPWADKIFSSTTLICSLILLIIIAAILVLLFKGSYPSIEKFGFGFLFSSKWNANTETFGAASSTYGTIITSAIAMLIAVPLSLVIALFLVELAHPLVAKTLGTAIELLAAVPSIIYGMWGILVFAPFIREYLQPFLATYGQKPIDFVCMNVTKLFVWFGWMDEPATIKIFAGPKIGIGILTAGIILAIMVLPFITAVVRDVLKMVPSVVKESAYGMGATSWEVTRKVTFKYGLNGIIGGTLLGFSRALGETMAVTYVIGGVHKLTTQLFQPGNTIASTLANDFNEADGLQYTSLIELGLILFLITFIVQLVFHLWLKRVRRKTGVGL